MKEELLIRYVAKECSEQENEQVLAWIEEDPAHQKRLDALKFVWESAASMQHRTSIDPVESLEKLKQKAAYGKHSKNSSFPWLKIAAVLICVTVLALFGQYLYRGGNEMLQAGLKDSTVVTTLADGSVVTLNKNALLDYPEQFRGRQRAVELRKGEAFFKVSPDRHKPFLIKANQISIRVLGTSFNVKIKNGHTEVIVETGKVMVTGAGNSWTLLPGQKLLLGEKAELLEEGKADELYQYYRSHVFTARNTPLQRMAEVLSEAYQVDIVIPDKELRQLPLNAVFKENTLEDILNVMAQTFGLKIERNGKQIRLTR